MYEYKGNTSGNSREKNYKYTIFAVHTQLIEIVNEKFKGKYWNDR